jgi:hypothetical protein
MVTPRRYYDAMDSGLYTKVFTSAEVIAASLFLILLLPLVFFIASTKSRRRFVRTTSFARPVRRPRTASRPTKEDQGEGAPSGSRQRDSEPDEGPGREADDRR